MPEKKKKYKNLSTYSVIMLLSVIILIIIAAMADGREQQFENQISEKEQTNMSIQNEIVTIKDENYQLTKEKEALAAQVAEQEKLLAFYSAMTEAWSLYQQGSLSEAAAVLDGIETGTLAEKEAARLEELRGALAARDDPEAGE